MNKDMAELSASDLTHLREIIDPSIATLLHEVWQETSDWQSFGEWLNLELEKILLRMEREIEEADSFSLDDPW